MNELTPAQLISKLESLDLRPRSYSGRGMYGKECVATSLDRYTHPSDLELPAGWRQDQLGLGTVVYWPGITWPEGRSEG